jgi:hypothetical protein
VRRGGLLLALLLATLGGCQYAIKRVGDDRFLRRPLPLQAGTTTLADVTSALGPPDFVSTRDDELLFLYRFEQRRDRSIVLRYFAARWLSGSLSEVVDRELILVFDSRYRLKHASSQSSQRGAE